MGRRLRHPSPAFLVALIALFAALGGGVYAIGKGKKIDGAKIKPKSLPATASSRDLCPGTG